MSEAEQHRRSSTDESALRAATFLKALPRWVKLASAVALVALVAGLDRITGSELSFSIFYLIPVTLAAAFISRGAGWVFAYLSASIWGYLEFTTGAGYSVLWIPIWNTGMRLGFFLLVVELVYRLARAAAHERSLSRIDSLTGIANGRVFEEYTMRAIAESRRTKRPFTITYVDLDRFKRVNDEFGHSEGDRLLRVAAELIVEELRATDVVARLGGDEFGILMTDTGCEEARVTLERIAETLGSVMQERWRVGATFGAVTFTEPPADVDEAVRLADGLMYDGKRAGRGCVLQASWPAVCVERDTALV
ncbi:MAG: GGDEF domain-containing protein [Actinobacteria bacterium]|nr:MAG: GGDEF domain-containing protein [Actinomycetota bacterium]